MIEHKQFENGFKYIEVSNDLASAKIALQGAHIFHYEKKEEEPLLWLSKKSSFENSKAIRGGVPICWPWFGANENDPTLPQHGFVRDSIWELTQIDESSSDSTTLVFKIGYSKNSLKLWPYKFELELKVTITDKLILSLITKNLDEKEFVITQALHTYLSVNDISDTKIEGLDNINYFDKLKGEVKIQKGDITISSECDRVYEGIKDDILLHDKNRTIKIASKGSSSVVVWNPWIEKCATMSGMECDGYKKMVCIESANALDDLRVIKPKESHTLNTVIG